MRVGQIGHRATIWSGAVVAVAVTVLGQHFFSFLDFKAAVAAQKPQGISLEAFEAVQEMRPDGSPNFARFMQRQATEGRPMNAGFNGWFTTGEYRLRGMAAWASWGVDGLLMLAATSTVVYLASRRPYCSVCRSWYRTTRAGPLAADRRDRWPRRRCCRSRTRSAAVNIGFHIASAVADRAGWNWRAAAG